jgi:hypothetical protein
MPAIDPSIPIVYPARAPVAVAASRALTVDDNGLVLRCAPGITLTVPDAGALPDGWAVNVLIADAAGGTVTLDPLGTATINASTANVSLSSTGPAMWMLMRDIAANVFICPV